MPINLSQIHNTQVLVRTNYDLPDLEHIVRITDSLATIEQLLDQGNQVIICSHWGRPKDNNPKLSLNPMDEILENKLRQEVLFVNQYDSFAEAKLEIDNTKAKVILLENTRYHADEKSKDSNLRLQLAKQYASLAKFVVDEAFAVSHRQEATNCEIKTLLPHCNGIAHEKELEHLDFLKNNPVKPFVVIMGGSKLETKLPLINKMLPKVDKLIVSGMLGFTFLQAVIELQKELNCPTEIQKFQVAPIYFSKVETEWLPQAKEVLLANWSKIVLPIDFNYDEINGQKMALDIGIDSVTKFQETVQSAKTIFWNGPMGFYEKKPFDKGTLLLGEYIANLKDCQVVIGGGDVGSALPSSILSQFSWVSMGGGATLECLSK